MPRLALIAAVATNGVIGHNNTLPWRLPDDLKYFKELTSGHPIIMGRKTWDSLGRPLPNRRNIVISRNSTLSLAGAEVCGDIAQALALCGDAEVVFVIGGREIYQLALPCAQTLYLTEVHASVTGDVYFPDFARQRFQEIKRVAHPADERHALAFDFVTYQAIEE